jgi:hypothetical protein
VLTFCCRGVGVCKVTVTLQLLPDSQQLLPQTYHYSKYTPATLTTLAFVSLELLSLELDGQALDQLIAQLGVYVLRDCLTISR